MAPKATIADRDAFQAKADELAAKLLDLEAALADDTVTIDDLAALPRQISDTRQALSVIQARLSQFEVEQLRSLADEAEAEARAAEKIVAATGDAQELWDIHRRRHDETIGRAVYDQAAVDAAIAAYAAALPVMLKQRAAGLASMTARGRLADYKRRIEAIERRLVAAKFQA